MTINYMHDAVQSIGRSVGVNDLTPNAAGAFELVFFNQLSVYFQIVGETEIEVQIRLGDGELRLTTDLMEAMLAANLGLRRGRLSLEPGMDRVVYCGRINTAHHDAASLTTAVMAIVREGLQLRLEGFDRLRAEVAARQSTADVLSETLMRV
jgi:hypothetical protein